MPSVKQHSKKVDETIERNGDRQFNNEISRVGEPGANITECMSEKGVGHERICQNLIRGGAPQAGQTKEPTTNTNKP